MITGDERDLLARTLDDATAGATGAALDAELAEIGWRDALADDPRVAISLLFEAQGRAGATSTALDAVLAGALGDGVPTDVTVVLPPVGLTDPPGRIRGSGLDVVGLAGPALAATSSAVVVSDTEGGPVWSAVPVDALGRRPVRGLDPALGLIAVDVTGAAAEVAGPASWIGVIATGQLALSHELVGASRTMLQLARDHAVERVQFGQPIASFQAVRHRLAEAFVAVEAAEATTDAAWDEGTAVAAAAAKAIAGRNARTVARHAQQVLAGIGFTREHPLHTHLRRVLVLDGLLGDARTLTRRMGAELLRERRLPPMLPL